MNKTTFELVPDLNWYLKKSTSANLSPRCKFASAKNCPRYFQSLDLLSKAGYSGIDKKNSELLRNKWEKSTLWPVADEEFTNIFTIGDSKFYNRFCPEVSYLCFGLFASLLCDYPDEIDRDTAYLKLSDKNYPNDHWKWSWERIVEQHYSECPTYSLLLNYSEDIMEKQNDSSIKTEEKPNISKLTSTKNTWREIENEFGIAKRNFGKKINFINDKFKREIIFRDVEHAYILASNNYSKPALILAGSVIEELLRQYLTHKDFSPCKDTFDEYIKCCESNGLLKTAISKLSDSVRQFRNLVHIKREESKRYTISKATAKGAVSSIFTIANDF